VAYSKKLRGSTMAQ